MCHKTAERNCVKVSLSQPQFRNWKHLCFTGKYENTDNEASGNFTLKGYFDGDAIGSSKSHNQKHYMQALDPLGLFMVIFENI